MRRFGGEPTSLELRADVRKVIARAYVDYTWIGDVDLMFRRSFNDRAGVLRRGASAS